MSAQADTNCHDIFNFVSATLTHLAKIGATCHVLPTCRDMSATFPAKVTNECTSAAGHFDDHGGAPMQYGVHCLMQQAHRSVPRGGTRGSLPRVYKRSREMDGDRGHKL